MFCLHHISLTHFKNHRKCEFHFEEPVIGITGMNGMGKTNLLDAIYYCCFTKSYFAAQDQLLSTFGLDGFRLEAHFEKQGKHYTVVCIFRPGSRKELLVNGVPYEKFSAHIGLFPAVFVTPDDTELINGGSEGRRKFVDTLLSQLDPLYLQELIHYNKILLQRNSLLKQMAEQQMRDQTLLEVIDSQLAASGELIFKRRQKLTEALLPLANSHYQDIAQKPEPLSINYESQLLQTSFLQWLQNNRERDLFLQRTNAGIHKDDLRFELDEKLFRQVASQGQRKSLLFALKIAEYDLLKKTNGFAPLMLLDDVFEKLDEQRMQNLLYKVCEERQGQVFITDTHETRLNEAFSKLKSASAIHTLVSGSVVKETNISSQ